MTVSGKFVASPSWEYRRLVMAQAVSTRGPVSGTANAGKKRRKLFLLDLYSTAVGKKYAMALSGIAMMGYVLAHMIGNLKMYLGPEDINHYGEFLRELLVPLAPRTVVLWILRIGLLGAVLLHIHAAYSLTVMNRQARSVKYQSERDYQVANFASRTMRWTGIIVLLFVLWHLSDLTWGWVNPGYVRGDVYRNVDASLSRVPVAILYVIANIALGIHLYHGAWSLFQSMGWNRPRFNKWRRGFAIGFATLIVVGNVSFPIAVLAGIVES
jgi:succinate dehydrogenase / fumarate reductase, cytochrome b subunit